MAEQLRLNPTCGWHDTVTAQLPLSEAAVASLKDRLTLYPLRIDSVPSGEVVDADRITPVIDQLAKSYDLVVIDMEPVEAGDQPPAEGESLHDAVAAIIVFDKHTTPQELEVTVAHLRAAGIDPLGAIENLVS